MSYDARAYAVRLLSQRSYTIRDLKRKLIQKGYSEDEAASVAQRLIGNGLLDDNKFAVNFARGRLLRGSVSKRYVRQKLSKKGISAAAADAAFDTVIEDEGICQRAALERLARKKSTTLQGLPPRTVLRRLVGFLARRGYDAREIQDVANRCLKAQLAARSLRERDQHAPTRVRTR